MAPILLLLFRMNPLAVVATDLFYNVPTKILGAIAHARSGTLNVYVSMYLGCGGIMGALIAGFFLWTAAKYFGFAALAGELRHWIGIAICLSALLTLIPVLTRKPYEYQADVTPNRFILIALGFFVGTIVIVTSVGAGAIMMPLLTLFLRRSSMVSLVSTDLAFSAVVTGVGSILYLSVGLVNVPVSLMLLAGSIPGVIIGSRISVRLGDRFLRSVICGILFFVGLRSI